MNVSRTARAAAVLVVAFGAACQGVAGLGDFQPPGEGASGPTGQGGQSSSSPGATSGGGAPGGGGGAGATSSTSTASTSTSTATSTTVTTSTGPACTLDHLVISEVRTRGPDDGNQDFIELFNPTAGAVQLDPSFRVEARGESANGYAIRWEGDGTITVPPGRHALLINDAGVNPVGDATPDGTYQSGIPDGASVVLYRGDQVLDAVCFSCESAGLIGDFVCEGEALSRGPSCAIAGDQSVQRRPSAGVDDCTDTDDNAADLLEEASTPAGSVD